MNRLQRALCLSTGVALATLTAGCLSIPHLVLRHHDIEPRRVGDPQAPPAVLIASRDSEFKRAVVERVAVALKEDGIGVKIRGVKRLDKEESAEPYAAVVLLNRCMSWSMDYAVRRFIRHNPRHDRIIVLTTSAPGDWTPPRRRGDFDAISAASEMSRVEQVADDILAKVRMRLGSDSTGS
ncbi:MAG: hypothetical protein GF331_08810 [Chitinivibrionales bacterium]|nr:hypothetical protein [Chitinivibrionales bacterium]